MENSLNFEILLKHLGNDDDLAREILQVFLVDGPDRTESFSKASESSDQALMIKFSHSLKGIAATIRAERLSSLAEEAEKFSRSGELDKASAMCPDLRSELNTVINEINTILS